MKYYVHRGLKVTIDNCSKSDNHTCVIGPFETQELAEAWVESHLSAFARPDTATAGDIRIKLQPRTKKEEV